MKKTHGAGSAIAGFFKRNATYIILALCIIAIGVSIALIMVGEKDSLSINSEPSEVQPADNFEEPKEQEPEETEPTISVISFCVPVRSDREHSNYSIL